mmetsp:Transcript_15324/g.55167  ORF Transcript_15324/g.55167 Transcript_15324/m.55167 type:complete len:224 (+) Transcript_15324:473-1144(+)
MSGDSCVFHDTSNAVRPRASFAEASAPRRNSARASVTCPRSLATCSGVEPSSSLAFTSHPPRRNASIVAVITARRSTASARLSPSSSSSPTPPPALSIAAWCSAVRSFMSLAFGAAPPSNNAATTSTCPSAAASMRHVCAKKSPWSGCSPRESLRATALASPAFAASCIVRPRVPPAANSTAPPTQNLRPAPAPGIASAPRPHRPSFAFASSSQRFSTARRRS